MTHADDIDVEILRQLKALDKKEAEHDLDEEGLYAQSIAGTLRKMTPEQRAMAKMKIQQILYEIQYCIPQTPYLDMSSDY